MLDHPKYIKDWSKPRPPKVTIKKPKTRQS